MSDYNHYIRINVNGIVIKGYSDAFEQMQTGDLLLSGQEGRHFQTQLMNDRGQYIYKVVSGAMVSRTQAELDTEYNLRPTTPPSIDARIKAAEDAILAIMGL